MNNNENINKKNGKEDIGRIIYKARIAKANSPVFEDPQVLSDFYKDLTSFIEKLLPQLRVTDDQNMEKDHTISSPLYIFIGKNAYAIDQIRGNSPTIFPYKNLEEVISDIDKILNMDKVKSIAVSTAKEELREKVKNMITNKGMYYNHGIVYKR
ncbi:MAG: hypothetical protein N3D84_01295 [Candidatus Woesearchaeota archaeon]|nr:hypothetical protein [Candidatus Woesearchaeota archaeon]